MSLKTQITKETPIVNLNEKSVKELQNLLNKHGYDLAVDGLIGAFTTNAFHEFKIKYDQKPDDLIRPNTVELLVSKPYASNYTNTHGAYSDISEWEFSKRWQGGYRILA